MSMALGMQTTLKCTFDTGGLEVEVKWYRGNKELSKSKRHVLSQTGRDATLTVKDMQSSDASQYTCVIYNSLGQAKSSCKIAVSGEYFHQILNFRDVLSVSCSGNKLPEMLKL